MASERIIIQAYGDLDLTHELARTAADCATWFAVSHIDREYGKHNHVEYGYPNGIVCSAHWTKARAVSVIVWRRDSDETEC